MSNWEHWISFNLVWLALRATVTFVSISWTIIGFRGISINISNICDRTFYKNILLEASFLQNIRQAPHGIIPIVCTPLPFLPGWVEGWASYQIWKKEGYNRNLLLEECRKERGGRGVTFLRGVCNFYTKNRLKSEIINDKKSL